MKSIILIVEKASSDRWREFLQPLRDLIRIEYGISHDSPVAETVNIVVVRIRILVGFKQLNIIFIKMTVIFVGRMMHEDVFGRIINESSLQPVIDIDRIERQPDMLLGLRSS